MDRTSEQIFFICDCFIISIYLFIIHLFLSINIHLNKIAIEHLNSYLEEHEEKFRALHGESCFKSYFEWSVVLFHIMLSRIFIWLAIHLFTPPLGVNSIGIRALVSKFLVNNLKEILVASHFINIFFLIHYSKNGRRY